MVADPMDDETKCPRCLQDFQWDGNTEASRICPSCRAEDAEVYRDYVQEQDYLNGQEPPRAA